MSVTATKSIRDTFERIYCISLARRPDRRERFLAGLPSDWPFRPVEIIDAVDGKNVKPPAWWGAGAGAWGCYRSHLSLIERCLNEGVESVLLLEDDAVFCDDFARKVTKFIESLPSDWGMLYLGGQHLKEGKSPPIAINDHVAVPFNVNRTHAFALRGKTMARVYEHLHSRDWNREAHVDHHLGRFHERREDPIYCPHRWLVAQNKGKSNINGRELESRDWNGHSVVKSLPIVAVLGQFRGGTSCVSGVLHSLGVKMGERFERPKPGNPKGFFEAVQLARICRQSYKEPWLTEQNNRGQRIERLRNWITRRLAGANGSEAIGGKHPTLCLMVPDLIEAWGPILPQRLRLIAVDRPVQESMKSIAKRRWGWPPKAIAALPAMVAARDAALDGREHYRIDYHSLVENPAIEIDRLVEWLGIKPTAEQRAAAVSFVEPSLRTVQ